ncbi:hypothetical protein AB0O18_14960 [Streptomyces sp. NPDC093224]|uniref:hypothetical protein n=1 Tax=unclassified Streptomyces TaxID=2593676 RepID=UPI00343EA764
MNGNPLYHAVALAVCTAIMLPVPLATLAGWTPRWSRRRPAGRRLRAYGGLCLYGLVLANGLPRLADASEATVTACSAVGLGFGAAAAVLFLFAAHKDWTAPAA